MVLSLNASEGQLSDGQSTESRCLLLASATDLSRSTQLHFVDLYQWTSEVSTENCVCDDGRERVLAHGHLDPQTSTLHAGHATAFLCRTEAPPTVHMQERGLELGHRACLHWEDGKRIQSR